MRKIFIMLLLLSVSTISAYAEEGTGPVEEFVAKQIDQLQAGCKTELETYCKTVTPGEGRLASCVYAHNDKLSSSCERALYSSSQEFEVAGAMLNAFVGACEKDIEKHCSKVVIGEGRVLKCLDENKEKISAKCNEARQQAKSGLEPKQEAA